MAIMASPRGPDSHEDMYNFDETGFAIGLIVTTTVVIRANIPKEPHRIQLGNSEWVTIINCINITSWVTGASFLYNLQGKVHIKGKTNIMLYHLTGQLKLVKIDR
jgi:hypothetical protein